MINIRNVSFQYANSEEGALNNVSLSVKSGECVLLCGESGCGKTTITRLINGLIPHFYEGNLEGDVNVGGLNVKEEELYVTAQKVGSVFQNPRSQFFVLILQVKWHLDVKIWEFQRMKLKKELKKQ